MKAKGKVDRFTRYGFLAGLAISVLVLLMAALNQGRNEEVQTVVNFFASVPVAIFSKFQTSDFFLGTCFFIYWVLMGTFLGWLVGMRPPIGLFSALILILALGVLHRALQLRIENELGAAVQAFAEFLSEVFER